MERGTLDPGHARIDHGRPAAGARSWCLIAELQSPRARWRDELPKPRGLRSGDQVRIIRGTFRGHLALYAGMSGRERVAVLLSFGTQHEQSCRLMPSS